MKDRKHGLMNAFTVQENRECHVSRTDVNCCISSRCNSLILICVNIYLFKC